MHLHGLFGLNISQLQTPVGKSPVGREMHTTGTASKKYIKKKKRYKKLFNSSQLIVNIVEKLI